MKSRALACAEVSSSRVSSEEIWDRIPRTSISMMGDNVGIDVDDAVGVFVGDTVGE